jgi:PAS domain S-box-containing protein
VKFELLRHLKILYVNDELSDIEIDFLGKYKKLVGKLTVVGHQKAFLEYTKDNYNRIVILIKSKDDIYLIQKIKSLKIETTIIGAVDSRSKDFLLDAIRSGIDRFVETSTAYDKIIKSAIQYVELDVLQSKLFDSYQYYNALIKFFIISKTDKNGLINYVNDKFCEISGFSRAYLIGKSHSVVRHKDMPDSVFQDLWSTILKKEAWQGTIKNSKKGGGFYIVDALIIPLLDKHNNIKEFLSIRKDITEQEILKDKIVNEIKEKELANEREKAKDSFLILFTHELKTPLNAIINFSDYTIEHIKKSDIDKKEKIVNLLRLSRDNATYMLNIVVNMLDVARLKSKKVQFHYTTFSLNKSIKNIVNNFSSLIEKKEMDIILEFRKESIIKSDELRFSQVISNIISNAIKYGDKTIFITLKDSEDYEFLITIEDDGAGIMDKRRVFEMYEQDNSNILNKEEGTGIGLYMVKLICEELNIEYSIEDSKKLKGTNFILKSSKKDIL